jgi:nigerose phosphorylase
MKKGFCLSEDGFRIEDAIPFGNRFLLGNGHLGYRGTLEEMGPEQMVELNVVGFYDRYQDKWRESVNAPNPFFIKVAAGGEPRDLLRAKPLSHQIELDFKNAIFTRKTVFSDLEIASERFVSSAKDDTLCEKYTLTAKKEINLQVNYGLDGRLYECNGPHYRERRFLVRGEAVVFRGITNEGGQLEERAVYHWNRPLVEEAGPEGLRKAVFSLKAGESATLTIVSLIRTDKEINLLEVPFQYGIDEIYNALKKDHLQEFARRWQEADVELEGDETAQFDLRYSLYHLLILQNKRDTSIPARGVSGETYKGAIFWDSEIFLLPFYCLSDPLTARSLLRYRIKTLPGAIEKAKSFGYQGAFYAWESQEDGKEACSLYNVSDAATGKPIRTYFNERQIHISADIVCAFYQYIRYSGDESILSDGGWDVAYNCVLFLASYATKRDGQYHLDGVIGPDEYHERINDNAFTNGMALFAAKTLLLWGKANPALLKSGQSLEPIEDFAKNLFEPLPNKDGVISQFEGYFNKENVSVETVRSRLHYPNEYWGGEKGVATPTRVIKQADVATLLVLLSDDYSLAVKKANYDFYYPYTEHGSSLSASMYSLLASECSYPESAYRMFRKSAEIELSQDQKMFAGNIYIGGTHPASNAGAYLSVVFGFAGLKEKDGVLSLNPHLPDGIESIGFRFHYRGDVYRAEVSHKTAKLTKEAKS